MRQLPDRALPAATARRLQSYQQQIDAIPEYAQQVIQADRRFTARNRVSSATFRDVRRTPTDMCSGVQRCGYCEDSAAIEIDHHKPKSLYPEAVFLWENYVYSCGGCNRCKSDKYAVFSAITGEIISVARVGQPSIVRPETGDVVLIDPRHENPLEFMRLDLLDTFRFLPIGSPTSRNYQRARYTIDALQLNARPYLPLARKQAYQGYLSHLHRYLRWRERTEFSERLHEPIQAIQNEQHPTIWAEMKRQHMLIPDLQVMFVEAPEALHW